ncbi:hypothetical protein ACWEOE_28850 [Amycolatopsis sp. NPDC004368]
MLLAADAPASGPPWLAVVLAVLTLLGVIATAAGPALVERIKVGKPAKDKGSDPPALPAPAIVQRTDQALDLVAQSLTDAYRERDEAQDQVKELLREVGRLNAELIRRDPTWDGGTSGRSA